MSKLFQKIIVVASLSFYLGLAAYDGIKFGHNTYFNQKLYALMLQF